MENINTYVNENGQNIQKWIQEGIDHETITFAYNMGLILNKPYGDDIKKNDKEALTTSQIRNIFGELRRIQSSGNFKSEKSSFLLLKPKLAYYVKRHNKLGIKIFNDFFCKAYDSIDKTDDNIAKNQFKNFIQLFEAILAYHKYHGGKE